MASRDASCSFCLKDHRDAGPLAEGPKEVFICGECIELCDSIIEQEKRRRAGKTRRHRNLAHRARRSVPFAARNLARLVPWWKGRTRFIFAATAAIFVSRSSARSAAAGPVRLALYCHQQPSSAGALTSIFTGRTGPSMRSSRRHSLITRRTMNRRGRCCLWGRRRAPGMSSSVRWPTFSMWRLPNWM
jgi:hypothetical protein